MKGPTLRDLALFAVFEPMRDVLFEPLTNIGLKSGRKGKIPSIALKKRRLIDWK
jgi:hypothetical protein